MLNILVGVSLVLSLIGSILGVLSFIFVYRVHMKQATVQEIEDMIVQKIPTITPEESDKIEADMDKEMNDYLRRSGAEDVHI